MRSKEQRMFGFLVCLSILLQACASTGPAGGSGVTPPQVTTMFWGFAARITGGQDPDLAPSIHDSVLVGGLVFAFNGKQIVSGKSLLVLANHRQYRVQGAQGTTAFQLQLPTGAVLQASTGRQGQRTFQIVQGQTTIASGKWSVQSLDPTTETLYDFSLPASPQSFTGALIIPGNLHATLLSPEGITSSVLMQPRKASEVLFVVQPTTPALSCRGTNRKATGGMWATPIVPGTDGTIFEGEVNTQKPCGAAVVRFPPVS